MNKKAKLIAWIFILIFLFIAFLWVWNKYTGKFKLGADAVAGCQNTNNISRFFGRAGYNLTTFNFFGFDITVNERIVDSLKAIQDEVNTLNTGYTFDDIQTYNLRLKRFGGGLSLHSWGIALDINPLRNPFQGNIDGSGSTDIPQSIIDTFKKHGFFWGVDWEGFRYPMHFEWYGAELSGIIVDDSNNQRIQDAAVFVDGKGAPHNNGEFNWTFEARPHEIKVKAGGYKDQTLKIEAICFSSQHLEIRLEPLGVGATGKISGQINIKGNNNILMPAKIYLDEREVGASNVNGEYIINNVTSGDHLITAKISIFPSETIKIPTMKPGDIVENLDITIGN